MSWLKWKNRTCTYNTRWASLPTAYSFEKDGESPKTTRKRILWDRKAFKGLWFWVNGVYSHLMAPSEPQNKNTWMTRLQPSLATLAGHVDPDIDKDLEQQYMYTDLWLVYKIVGFLWENSEIAVKMYMEDTHTLTIRVTLQKHFYKLLHLRQKQQQLMTTAK